MRLDDCSYEALYPVIELMLNEVRAMRTCFLLTHIPNPRINKRIAVFKHVGETKVICTRRSSQNIWEPIQDVEHIIFDIDLPSAKHIIKRYVVSQDFQKKALDKLKEIMPNVIYAEGLDSLIIAGKYKRDHNVKIIFEVADLRENYIVKPKKTIDRIITNALLKKEKTAFENVDYLVVTSPKFYDMHYKNMIPEEKMLFIPNAPDTEVFSNYKKKEGGAFTIGFIGGIRYLKQMKMLVDVADEVGFSVLFAGAGGTSSEYDEIREYCEGRENIIFTGKYNYDTEIAELYGKVDCVFSVYDADNPNVRIALPNKLYESIICELPIIVAKGTYVSELVEQYGVGVSVSHEDKNDLIQVMRRMKDDSQYRLIFVNKCKEYKESQSSFATMKELENIV
ncbi:glycosyltransferase [Roseburia hominis]